MLFGVGIFVLCLAGCAEEGARVKKCSGAKGKELIVGKEGFWRLKRDGNGVWWFLSLEGKEEFLNTVTTVQPYQKGQDENGPHYVSKDWEWSIDEEVWRRDFKPDSNEISYWAEKTAERVKQAGFKGLGAWCNGAFHKQNISISRDLNIWSWVGRDKLFYDNDWQVKAEEAIRNRVTALRDNRNLVGYYIDNELGWKDGFGSADWYFDKLAADNPNRREVMKVIRSEWPTVESFNKDWQTQLKDWSEMDKWEKLPVQPAKTLAKLNDVWRYHLARDYIKCATELIRKHDSNHLILGMRFKGGVQREVCRAARGLTDAMSINVYASDARLDKELMETIIHNESEQPIIITEYAFHSIDGRSNDKNRCGFIWGHVLDQKARAEGYKLFTTRLARLPYIIGADWFQWNDEPPSGRGDGEDVNFGVVDINDELYEDLAEAIRQTTPTLNDLHSKSFSDTQQDIWAKSGDKPAALNIPYLETAISLDGDLSDWPTESKAGDIKYLETIGIERAGELVSPKVCLGWREDGLYAGMEVFDKNIDGYALNEESLKNSWRCRSFDCAEVWFSTRPATDGQNWYDRYCCDFMFIPDGNGTVMQWHHRGDALEGDRIPHPDIKHFFKKSAEGYTVEMFIPASVLNGFEPKANGEMSGNIFVRNWQPRIDWYWACGEFGQPGAWGKMKLIK